MKGVEEDGVKSGIGELWDMSEIKLKEKRAILREKYERGVGQAKTSA